MALTTDLTSSLTDTLVGALWEIFFLGGVPDPLYVLADYVLADYVVG